MKGIIIVRESNVSEILNMKGYIEMRIRKHFDKLTCQLVDDAHTCVAFQVKTKKKTFESIKDELNELYPKKCVYVTKKEEA